MRTKSQTSLFRGLLFAWLASIFFTVQFVQAQVRTVILVHPSDTNLSAIYPESTTITVVSNEVFELLGFPVNIAPQIGVCFGDNTNAVQQFTPNPFHSRPLMFTGPAMIKLEWVPGAALNTYTYRLTRQPDTFAPNAAVVIPADAQGPVTIRLESSTNLVVRQDALPGTYGSSSVERYFRVRAIRN